MKQRRPQRVLQPLEDLQDSNKMEVTGFFRNFDKFMKSNDRFEIKFSHVALFFRFEIVF